MRIAAATTAEKSEETTRGNDGDSLPFFSSFPFVTSSLFGPCTAVAFTDFTLFLRPFHYPPLNPEASLWINEKKLSASEVMRGDQRKNDSDKSWMGPNTVGPQVVQSSNGSVRRLL